MKFVSFLVVVVVPPFVVRAINLAFAGWLAGCNQCFLILKDFFFYPLPLSLSLKGLLSLQRARILASSHPRILLLEEKLQQGIIDWLHQPSRVICITIVFVVVVVPVTLWRQFCCSLPLHFIPDFNRSISQP